MDALTIGVDLGQAQDPTAIAVAEKKPSETHIRHLERLPLGTLYPRVCESILRLTESLPGSRLVGSIDGTGVGRAVVDSLEASGLVPVVVSITSGKKVRREGNRLWVPKAELIRPLVTGLEAGMVKIAAGLEHGPALLKELQAFQVTLGERGHVGFEGKGEHDDMVIAVALTLISTARS